MSETLTEFNTDVNDILNDTASIVSEIETLSVQMKLMLEEIEKFVLEVKNDSTITETIRTAKLSELNSIKAAVLSMANQLTSINTNIADASNHMISVRTSIEKAIKINSNDLF